MDRTRRISRLFALSHLAILLALATALSALFLHNYREAAREHAESIRAEVLRSKREFIKDAVDRTIQHIEQERATCASREPGSCDEAAVKERLRVHIRAIRLKDDGYIWVNAIRSYGGGDGYARRFVHPNLPETEGMALSTAMKDIRGNTPYLTELEGVKAHGEIFFDYWFKKMGSERVEHKLTFARLYRPYDWIVATGVYLDDVEERVAAGAALWEDRIRRNAAMTVALTAAASLLAWFLSMLVGRRMKAMNAHFLGEVARREEELRRFNLELEAKVTARTKEIEASRRRYLDLYENAPDMHLATDAATGAILQCNRTLASVTGRAPEELLERPMLELFHLDCEEEARRAQTALAEAGEVRDRELRLRCRDGAPVDVSVNASASSGDDGVVLHRWTLRDITERKRREAISRSRLHLLQFATSHGTDELLVEALDEAERLTGSRVGFCHLVEEGERALTLQAWSTRTRAEFCTVAGQGLHYPLSDAGVWADCVRERRPLTHNDYESLPGRRGMPPGHPRLVRELTIPVLRAGKIRAALGVGNKPTDYDARDEETLLHLVDQVWEIVERKQAEEDRRRLYEELERRVAERTAELQASNAELEAFAYSVSHDLRAPLRHIDGYLGLLERELGARLGERERHLMQSASSSAQRMGALIDDLLSFSRMGRSAMSMLPIDLGQLVAEVMQELSPEVAGREVEWRVAELPQVRGDRAMLRVVLCNLLSNAVKFTRLRERPRIEIGAARGSDDEVELYVRDNGVGFDMRHAGRLFGVFQRLHRCEEYEGTGIGLATVRRIVDRHGGRTWAESEPDRGASFHFTLPRFG